MRDMGQSRINRSLHGGCKETRRRAKKKKEPRLEGEGKGECWLDLEDQRTDGVGPKREKEQRSQFEVMPARGILSCSRQGGCKEGARSISRHRERHQTCIGRAICHCRV